MARFNKKTTTTKTENLAGGKAYKESAELELITILLSSFVQDQFYRKATDTVKRIKEVIQHCDPVFVAKSAIFARNEFGMRSITHITAGEIAKNVKGESWTKNFFKQVFKRPDDILETFSYYIENYGKRPIPKALRKGANLKLVELKDYALAKYRGEGKSVKMVDVVNLCHPKATESLSKLMKGELKSTETWETQLTQAGQQAKENEELDLGELKSNAWAKLLNENKLGYLALLRNVRNIIKQSPDSVGLLCEQLVNREAIKKSLVFPFQINTAIKEVKTEVSQMVLMAMVKALEISLDNVPKFEGSTCVVVDSSGSMAGKPAEIATLFASVLVKVNQCDLMSFSDNAKYDAYIGADSLFSISNSFKFASGGTNFHSIFQTMNKAYDRIIILSDMQGWIGYNTPVAEFNKYKAKYDCNPFIYSFDLQGHGTMQFPEDKVCAIAGFSDKIFEVMKLLEQDKNALINKIKAVSF